MSLINTDAIWVENDQTLNQLCQQWRQQAAIAVDTEFERTTTFYPQVALIQIGDGRQCYLIDPLKITDPAPLRDLLVDPAVTKVFHACSEDTEVFQRYLGVVPTPLFDTQLAAAFTDIGFSLGYARLVETLLGVELPKTETRSDWLQRPLSQAQCRYAAMDVAYLLVIYGKLLQQLRQLGREEWVKADCANWVKEASREADPLTYYLKVKNSWRLERQQLGVLQSLCAWRELEARARNIPRNRLVKENALCELAKRQPRHASQLYKIEGLTPRIIEAEGDEILAVIADALELDPSAFPEALPAPLSPELGVLMKQLKQLATSKAESLGMAPEILVRKRDLEALIRSGSAGSLHLPDSLIGWRQAIIGNELMDAAQEWFAVKKP